MNRIPTIALLLSSLSVANAQNPCEGSGIGQAYMTTTHAILGAGGIQATIGSPAAANSVGLLLFGNDANQSIPFCLDTSGFFLSLIAVLDASGNAQFNLPLGPAAFDATLYAKPLIWELPGSWSLGKTVRMQTEWPDSYRDVPAAIGARSLHTCTSLSQDPTDNVTGALVAGGATGNLIAPTALDTTEVFDTITRTWTAGPTMSEPRSNHAATLLADGSVLITGGMTNAATGTGGPATASVDLYVRGANTIVPFAPMLQARAGHAATLLGDGRILVSGGFADWTDAGPNFVARLGTAQDTTEIFDPTSGSWTAGPTMASQRAGHTQTLLPDGRVLITAGCNGGQTLNIFGTVVDVPTFTFDCEIFDPTTNMLSPTGSLSFGLGFHGAGLLPNGQVLVTGGAASNGLSGEAVASAGCSLFDPATGTWTTAAQLPNAVAFHTQIMDQVSGDAVITGGFIGNFANLQGSTGTFRHDGSAVTTLAAIGDNPSLAQAAFEVGTHAAAQLHDGSILIACGFEWTGLGGQASSRSLLYFLP